MIIYEICHDYMASDLFPWPQTLMSIEHCQSNHSYASSLLSAFHLQRYIES